MTVNAIIQARMSSTRLPNKVLIPLAGRPVLGWVVRAAQLATTIDTVVVATSDDPSDDPLVKFCSDLGVACVRGSLDDVLDRYIAALDAYPADVLVRLTADCPMLDPAVIDHAVGAFQAGGKNLDYLSTVLHRSLPHGLDVEVFTAAALRSVNEHARDFHRAHVTSAIYADPKRYRVAGLSFAPDSSDLRVTLDTPHDAQMLTALADEIGDTVPAWRDLVSLLRSRPDIAGINAEVKQKAIHEG